MRLYILDIIIQDGIIPVKEKIDAIKSAKEPTNVSELKSFLGLLNYYHRHFQNFADTLEPLYNLLRKGVTWEWTEKEQASFEKAKLILNETKLLVHCDPQKPIILACDASPYGTGAVLSHYMLDGSEKPVTFASQTLSQTERNYSQIEKESLAIIYAIKMFHQYLFGKRSILFTDHKTLLGLLSETKGIPNMAAAQMQRGAILLSAYDYTLKYRMQIFLVVFHQMKRPLHLL